MAHVQRKCDRCRKSVPAGARTCPACSSRGSSYVARYRGTDGRERSQSFQRKVDAERFIHDNESRRGRGEWTDPALGRERLDVWAREWLDAAKPTLKPKTAATYASLLRSRILLELGGFRLSELKPSDVQAWVNRMDVSPSRVRQAHIVLSLVMKAAFRDGRIGRNPRRAQDFPASNDAKPLTSPPRSSMRLPTRCPPPTTYSSLSWARWARFGEGAALRRRSVDLLRRRLVISESLAEVGGKLAFGPTKTHAQRSVPLPPSIAERLDDHLSTIPAHPRSAPVHIATGCTAPLLELPPRSVATDPPSARLTDHGPSRASTLRRSSVDRCRCFAEGRTDCARSWQPAFTLTVYGHLFDADMDALARALDVFAAGPARDRNFNGEIRIRALPS
jgi:hypothetical protein